MIDRITRLVIPFLLVVAFMPMACCHQDSHTSSRLDLADSLMETAPDSALTILDGIAPADIKGKEESARYALLRSMALDKNYVDTTTFDVLQPAIDLYLENGSPDQKLRTYYYMGRIYENKGDKDNAFMSFVKGLEDSANCEDSLCIARSLVARSWLCKEFYDFENYTQGYLEAAEIYEKQNRHDLEFDCLLNALNGSIILNDQKRADSIMGLCSRFETNKESHDYLILQDYRLSYALRFGSVGDIKNFVDSEDFQPSHDINGLLNLASAFNRLGDNASALKLLEDIKNSKLGYDTLKYEYIQAYALYGQEDYKDAFSVYRDFSMRVDSINAFKFDQKAQSMEEKFRLAQKAEFDKRNKSAIIRGCIYGIVLLILAMLVLILSVRAGNAKKDLAIQKALNAEYENKKLKSEKDLLSLENKNLQLQRDNMKLEAENLAHRVENLENERDCLNNLMDNLDGIPEEVRKAIKIRIEILNSILAKYITDNDKYGNDYDLRARELTDDIQEFMNSTRLAFQVSHPRFIKYFESHDLTISEINYVCLYAIGLNGKEVGSYIKKRGHVNTSSIIRKKLGIDRHNTNIGIYVRKLLRDLQS